MISFKEAQEIIVKQAVNFPSEEIDIHASIGRICSHSIVADRDYPPFNRSAMDGFAINSAHYSKEKEYKIVAELHAGSPENPRLTEENSCVKIMTGAAVPEDADAVIRIEDCEIQEGIVKFNIQSIKPWTNIAKRGEDAGKGYEIVPANTLITPGILSVIASVGIATLKVNCLPKIAIISTGNEVKSVYEDIKPYQIRDSNSYALSGFLDEYKIKPSFRALVNDDKEDLLRILTTAMHSDIVIISGGVSMGDADFIPEILQQLGVTKIFHKVSIKPGKPFWFGKKDNTVVFGLPGNPMSCQVGYKLFIEPYIRALAKLPPLSVMQLKISAPKKKKTILNEFFPCRINFENMTLESVKINGSGDITSTWHSHGLALHPSDNEELPAGTIVPFIPWKAF